MVHRRVAAVDYQNVDLPSHVECWYEYTSQTGFESRLVYGLRSGQCVFTREFQQESMFVSERGSNVDYLNVDNRLMSNLVVNAL